MPATNSVARSLRAIGHLAKKHAYPGVDLPLRHFPQDGSEGQTFFRIGTDRSCEGSISPMLQLREIAMLILMDRLTDKFNWHQKVFENDIVAKWRHEALNQSEEELFLAATRDKHRDHDELCMPDRHRIISENCFNYACLPFFNPRYPVPIIINPSDRPLPNLDAKLPSSARPV